LCSLVVVNATPDKADANFSVLSVSELPSKAWASIMSPIGVDIADARAAIADYDRRYCAVPCAPNDDQAAIEKRGIEQESTCMPAVSGAPECLQLPMTAVAGPTVVNVYCRRPVWPGLQPVANDACKNATVVGGKVYVEPKPTSCESAEAVSATIRHDSTDVVLRWNEENPPSNATFAEYARSALTIRIETLESAALDQTTAPKKLVSAYKLVSTTVEERVRSSVAQTSLEFDGEPRSLILPQSNTSSEYTVSLVEKSSDKPVGTLKCRRYGQITPSRIRVLAARGMSIRSLLADSASFSSDWQAASDSDFDIAAFCFGVGVGDNTHMQIKLDKVPDRVGLDLGAELGKLRVDLLTADEFVGSVACVSDHLYLRPFPDRAKATELKDDTGTVLATWRPGAASKQGKAAWFCAAPDAKLMPLGGAGAIGPVIHVRPSQLTRGCCFDRSSQRAMSCAGFCSPASADSPYLGLYEQRGCDPGSALVCRN